MRSLKITLVLLFISLCLGCTEYEQKSGQLVDALNYIKKEKRGNNLSLLAAKVAKVTQTYKMMVKKEGQGKADILLANALRDSIAKYQHQWDENLAQAYSEHLNQTEINSLYYNGKNSPFYKKQMSLQKSIGNKMKALSDKLLNTVVSDALQNAFQAMGTK